MEKSCSLGAALIYSVIISTMGSLWPPHRGSIKTEPGSWVRTGSYFLLIAMVVHSNVPFLHIVFTLNIKTAVKAEAYLFTFWGLVQNPSFALAQNPVHRPWQSSCVCLIWRVQIICPLKAELVQSCVEEQDAKGTLTPAKPDLSLLATGNPGTDVRCWDFSPKISRMFNSHSTDLLLLCIVCRRARYQVAGRGRRYLTAFLLLLKMTQEKILVL